MTDLAYLPGLGERARKSRARPSALAGWILPLALTGVWEAASRAGLIAPNHLPAPSIVAITILHLAQSGDLTDHLAATLGRLGLGFLLGAAAGTVAGALTGASRTLRLLVDPLIQGLRSVPSIAWVPLFILWLGIFEASKVALIAVGVFFPVYLNLMSGIAGVDRKLIEVGRAHRLSHLDLIRRVLLPAALPAYIVGLRGGLGLGWMFVAAAELMGASEGLGFLLVDGQQTGRPAVVIAAILLFALLGKLSDIALARTGQALTAWQDTEGDR
ncbi:MAG: transporter permease [Rhodospirillales bacterium]|nr:transporter permease [Rhodospirillales bacterium]